MKQNRLSRGINETARIKLSHVLMYEISDPALEFVGVVSCEVSIDKSYMRVWLSCEPGADEEVLTAISRAQGRIRKALGSALKWRVVPELKFEIDHTLDEALKISKALQNVPSTLSVEKDDAGYPIADGEED